MWWSWRRLSEKTISCILSLSTWRKTSISSWRTGKKKELVCISDIFATCKKLVEFENVSIFSGAWITHLKHITLVGTSLHNPQRVHWFWVWYMIFLSPCFVHVATPSGYPLYTAAKSMKPSVGETRGCYSILCAVLGTHQEITSVKGIKAVECILEIP